MQTEKNFVPKTTRNECNKVFRHIETLFVPGNQIRTDQNKPTFLLPKKFVCFDQYELDYLGRIKFLRVEMSYATDIFFYIMSEITLLKYL